MRIPVTRAVLLVLAFIPSLVNAQCRGGAIAISAGYYSYDARDYTTINCLPVWVVEGEGADPEKWLLEILRRHGLELFSRATREYMTAHFDDLKSFYIESQLPGNNLHYDIHEEFRRLADPADVDRLCSVFRNWLEAPDSSIAGRSSQARVGALARRAIAAELLSRYGDMESKFLIMSMIATGEYIQETRRAREKRPLSWYLLQAKRRIDDPCSAAVILPTADGELDFCNLPGSVDSVVFWFSTSTEKVTYRPDEKTTAKLLRTLLLGRQDVSSHWGGGETNMILYCRNGHVAYLDATEQGRFVYEDNTRLEHWDMTIRNDSLYGLVENLLKPMGARLLNKPAREKPERKEFPGGYVCWERAGACSLASERHLHNLLDCRISLDPEGRAKYTLMPINLGDSIQLSSGQHVDRVSGTLESGCPDNRFWSAMGIGTYLQVWGKDSIALGPVRMNQGSLSFFDLGVQYARSPIPSTDELYCSFVSPPEEISRAEPEYPVLFRNAGLTGIVAARLFIDENGSVEKVGIVHSGGTLFSRSVKEAFAGNKYVPAKDRDGNNRKSAILIAYEFTLPPPPEWSCGELLDQRREEGWEEIGVNPRRARGRR